MYIDMNQTATLVAAGDVPLQDLPPVFSVEFFSLVFLALVTPYFFICTSICAFLRTYTYFSNVLNPY